MKIKYLVLVLSVVFLASISMCPVSAAVKQEVKTPTTSSTLDDQTGVALTIYNVNLGLVKDQRAIKLLKGIGDLRFMDVASQIMPTSVHIKSLVKPETLRVLEQNYEVAKGQILHVDINVIK